MKKIDIEKEIEKTLGSLDNHERVGASPFFYTKLQQRLGQSKEVHKRQFSFWNVWQFALVAVLVFINVFTIVEFTGSNDYNQSVNTMASEYGINNFENISQDYITK